MQALKAERPMAEPAHGPWTDSFNGFTYKIMLDGQEAQLVECGGGENPIDRDTYYEDLELSIVARELLRVVAERDEARARIVALETENAELRKDLGRAERAIQSEGEQAFDAGLSEGWSLHKEVSSGR